MSRASVEPANPSEPGRGAALPGDGSLGDDLVRTTPPAPGASVEEIEARIVATRDRLAESVDALADKVNVKAQAERKVEQTKERATAKVAEATEKAKGAVSEATDKAQRLLSQTKSASRPVQVAIVSLPVTVIVLLIAKAIRGSRS